MYTGNNEEMGGLEFVFFTIGVIISAVSTIYFIFFAEPRHETPREQHFREQAAEYRDY